MRIFAFTLSLALLISSCSKKNNNLKKDKIAHIALRSDVSTLDPANAYDSVSISINSQIYEQLYEYHYLHRPYLIQPLLAKSLPSLNRDRTQYTIEIKKDIHYHDHPVFKGKTRSVKAIDFIHQIKRIALSQTKSNGWFLFENKIKGLDEFRKNASSYQDILNKNVSGLQAPNDSTLIITLKAPYPQLKYILAMGFASPMPYEAIEFYKNNLNERPMGTGPFKLTEWNRGLNLILEQNPHYRQTTYPQRGDSYAKTHGLLEDAGKYLPFLSKIKFHIIKESQTRWLNFLNKKIDFLPIPKDNFNMAITAQGELSPELKGKDISLQIVPTFTYWWVAFNMTDPIIGKNLKLRQAIAHSIDIKKYLKLFTNNIGQKANSIFIPEITGYDSTAQVNFQYNLEKAKKLLAESGYPEGEKLPTFTYSVRGSSTFNRQQGEYFQEMLEKIGIKIKVEVNTFPGFLQKMRRGKLQIWTDGWVLDYPDAENISHLLYSKNHPPGPNHSFYSNPKVDHLITQLKYLEYGGKKSSIMKKINQQVLKDLPWIPLYYQRNYILYQNYFKNFRKSDLISNYLKYIKISTKKSTPL